MSIYAKFKKAWGKFTKEVQFSKAELEDGTQIEYLGESLAVGDSSPNVIDADGNISGVLPDGTYKTKDTNISFVVTDGLISEVTQPEPAAETTEEVEQTEEVKAEAVEVSATKEIAATIVEAVADALAGKVEFKKVQAKFAAGTPEERIANLETIVTSLFEYCYGWQLEEKDRKAQEEAAIATYKANFSKINSDLAQLGKVVEVIASQPNGKPITGAVGFNKKPLEASSNSTQENKTRAAQILAAAVKS